jgi:electron transport complex protein RnfE
MMQAGGMIEPILILILPPGGFFIFGILVAAAQRMSDRIDAKAVAKGLKAAGKAECASCAAAPGCSGCSPTPTGGES